MSGATRMAEPAQATERSMLDLLLDRYTSIRPGTTTDRWIRAEHVKAQLGYGDNQRIADFVAADRHFSTLALHGHEVKVSRSDWLTELRSPEKAEAIKRYMTYWWLVAPDDSIVKPGELPCGWGLMTTRNGRLRVRTSAPRLNPEPVPLEFTVSLMASAARTAHREPLRCDAPLAQMNSRKPLCGFCGTISPCAIHQPQDHADRLAA